MIYQIAIPCPPRQIFEYKALSSKDSPKLGARILVPFGKRKIVGILVGITNKSNLANVELKPIEKILDDTSILSDSIDKLLGFAHRFYQYPLGLIYDAAMPSLLKKLDTKITIESQSKAVRIAAAPQDKKVLNKEQQDAINIIKPDIKNQTNKVYLLDGITGSGKTEVYLQLIEATLEAGMQSLIIVPEIGLTPQTVARFKARFNAPIAVIHSKLSAKEKFIAWQMAKTGNSPIIIGTRSAVFTPMQRPGLYIIDEEHDLSLKQQTNFRYSAKHLTLMRAKYESCPVVLGTATPALETLHQANTNAYQLLKLTTLATNIKPPKIEIIDIRHKKLQSGMSNKLLDLISQHLELKSQVLLFINRRGFSPVVMCADCGYHFECSNCDAKMVYHQDKNKLICHHCEINIAFTKTCPACNKESIIPVGQGTQKIEEFLKSKFQEYNIARIDKDNTATKTALNNTLDKIQSGQIDIIIGTQMLAKGHHFPRLSMVAILDIDSAFFSADFRAIERMGQLITQVAGRAGREKSQGHVVIQTLQPKFPLLQTLINDGYHVFAEQLLQERKLANLPPFSYQILFRAETKQESQAIDFLSYVKTMAAAQNSDCKLLGPVPAPMEKRQGAYRAQLLLQHDSRAKLNKLSSYLVAKIEANPLAKKIRWSIDVEPEDLF